MALDEDGYPTEETLEEIRTWDDPGYDFNLFMELVKENWHWACEFVARKFNNKTVYSLSTGGWSGNEDIIQAMQGNDLFWLMCWQSSRRGGHYIFIVKDPK